MNGLYHEYHHDKEIVVIDYSIVPHEEEFELMKYSLELFSNSGKSDHLVLEIISKVKLTHEMIDYLPEYIERIKPYVAKWASLGIGEEVVKQMPHLPLYSRKNPSIKNKNIKWFESKAEAIDFLTA